MSIFCNANQSRGRLYQETVDKNRTCFQRDRDRIIHSGAFRKLEYKTQVFINHEGDYYRTRLTHTLEVAQITRAICNRLNLNESLGEAIALAHDLGHTPFGHAGEDALQESTKKYGSFDHNAQSLRIVTFLEQRYALFDGMNLTWEVLEGIAKHNGPIPIERRHKTLNQYNTIHNLELDTFPSAEAQVASIADDIAYNAHDIDDGIRSQIIKIDDLYHIPFIGEILNAIKLKHPGLKEGKIRHEALSQLICYMIDDIVNTTNVNIQNLGLTGVEDVRMMKCKLVHFSSNMAQIHKSLQQFLKEKLYRYYKINRIKNKMKKIVKDLFHYFYTHTDCLPPEWQQKANNPSSQNELVTIICDFISGMTDRFALKEHKILFGEIS